MCVYLISDFLTSLLCGCLRYFCLSSFSYSFLHLAPPFSIWFSVSLPDFITLYYVPSMFLIPPFMIMFSKVYANYSSHRYSISEILFQDFHPISTLCRSLRIYLFSEYPKNIKCNLQPHYFSNLIFKFSRLITNFEPVLFVYNLYICPYFAYLYQSTCQMALYFSLLACLVCIIKKPRSYFLCFWLCLILSLDHMLVIIFHWVPT